ncbi:SDR family NAD(P)-dependent oxidoreductase [Parafrankia sp. FMc6]|uniref:SDR family NAD(P)-dependent oxidoreductase n=1 Tax=Parafrankia soli TaxID=2599596 RepID=UPI0034D7AFB5
MKQTIDSESADKVGIIAPVQNRRARVANSFAIADIVTGAVLTVTGAGGGLGRAITAELARRGFAVWATDVELGIAEPVVEGLGSECRAAVLDVTDASASRALADAIVAEQ